MENKLSLYFNCKLTNKRLIPNSLTSEYFYPVIYPRNPLVNNVTQYEVLIETIKSYSAFDFKYAIFNIEIDGVDDLQKTEISEIISRIFKYDNFNINFVRPSNLASWRSDIKSAIALIGLNSPVLVVMNHDHPYVDYAPSVFVRVIDQIFSGDNFCKAFYYSHAPEVISLAMNGLKSGRFNLSNTGICESILINNWLDSYCVMTLGTLDHIFSKLKYSGDYIGRFDWPGASYDNLKLRTYVFPREFFKHYDGYGHVSGLRLFSDVNLPQGRNLTNSQNNSALINYQRWLDAFILLIRDSLRNRIFLRKKIFVDEIERSLLLFDLGYFKQDLIDGLLDEGAYQQAVIELRNAVYFNANSLFFLIKDDIFLTNSNSVFYYKKLIPQKMLLVLRKIKLLTRQVTEFLSQLF
jgi:hypothetical protein